jgi:hypothetical protein
VTPLLVAPHPAATNPLPLPGREFGGSRHPLAAGCNTVGAAYLERSAQPPTLNLATFSSVGKALALIPFGTANVASPSPALAALPNDSFVIAWTDFDGDGDELGIQLRKIDPALAAQAESVFANSNTPFSQRAPDIIFDGAKLVVAWVDDSDPATAPDLRYRTFAPDLTPLTDDQTLAATPSVEGQVALAAFNGAWAAAWRSGTAGAETIEAQLGTTHWTVGPLAPGAPDDRPALAFIDATHLAVAFTEGTDPSASGAANTPRLHAAIFDAAVPGLTPSFAIAPTVMPYATAPTSSQTQPTLAVFSDRLLVGWRSSAVPGDALGDELWTREVKWSSGGGNTLLIDTSSPELRLLPSALRAGDQSTPVLLSSNLWPEHRLLSAWQDEGKTLGSAVSGTPDVVLQFAPAPTTDAATVPFELSGDGKYYNVNVLRRAPSFPAATATAVYSGGAVQYLFPPKAAFDGDDTGIDFSGGVANPSFPANPDAIDTVTIDLGRVITLAASRQRYRTTSARPDSFQLRLAETLGQWTTVVPEQFTDRSANRLDESILSEFPATRARYAELRLKGVISLGVVELNEFFLYPSAPLDPPPSTLDGYDLTYLSSATATYNSNMIGSPAVKLFTNDFFTSVAGKTLAQGATGDGVITIDLGGWYAISKVAMGFYANSYWTTGGAIEISADQSSWTKVYDSGRGNPLGSASLTETAFTFPKQTARYLRITNYFIAGQGLSTAGLEVVQVF